MFSKLDSPKIYPRQLPFPESLLIERERVSIEEQPYNAYSSIVGLEFIVMLVIFEQSLNAYFSMEEQDSIVTPVRLEQPLNASSPIVVQEVMFRLVSAVQE